ncbi:flagellar basal body-associated FliL family protein [Pengzhenrongella sicca]|uniref:Flagellar protein FliL n=1 Tax=Pengzhenrongella sicca TaxID=2819238 RepID=A0A8A4ZD24_9MICO|nr:flagellar basal body-associated FliL family protein [Pengzhenrongella sicca]QTE29880.1 flagellar basal body-associated FliL family protein [Pengzhenrongella sicca]
MSIEQRVVSSAGRSVGGIRAGRGKPEPEPVAEAPKKRFGKPSKKVLIIAVAVLLVVAGAVYFFLLKPGGSDTPAAEPAPVAGEVLTVDAVSVNLVDGHYLRLGLGLQLTEGEHEGVDPAKALDLAIALFSGHTVAEVTDPATREALKAELVAELSEAYEGEVMDVYLTDFVTQ